MDPRTLLEALCRRHGLPYAAGKWLLWIVRSALEQAPPLRQRLIEFVDRNLADQAQRAVGQRDAPGAGSGARAGTDAPHEAVPPQRPRGLAEVAQHVRSRHSDEGELLTLVARILHGWNPSTLQ